MSRVPYRARRGGFVSEPWAAAGRLLTAAGPLRHRNLKSAAASGVSGRARRPHRRRRSQRPAASRPRERRGEEVRGARRAREALAAMAERRCRIMACGVDLVVAARSGKAPLPADLLADPPHDGLDAISIDSAELSWVRSEWPGHFQTCGTPALW